MAVCRIIETGRTPEEYDQVRERIGVGDRPPAGALLRVWPASSEDERRSSRNPFARSAIQAVGGVLSPSPACPAAGLGGRRGKLQAVSSTDPPDSSNLVCKLPL